MLCVGWGGEVNEEGEKEKRDVMEERERERVSDTI